MSLDKAIASGKEQKNIGSHIRVEKLTASHAGITVAAHGAFQTGHTNTTKK